MSLKWEEGAGGGCDVLGKRRKGGGFGHMRGGRKEHAHLMRRLLRRIMSGIADSCTVFTVIAHRPIRHTSSLRLLFREPRAAHGLVGFV